MTQFTDEELIQKVQDGYIVESPEEMTEGYKKALRMMRRMTLALRVLGMSLTNQISLGANGLPISAATLACNSARRSLDGDTPGARTQKQTTSLPLMAWAWKRMDSKFSVSAWAEL